MHRILTFQRSNFTKQVPRKRFWKELICQKVCYQKMKS